ncbi:related to allantoate permease [Phialocephala subalpina]|uniref:Related to allantoate permease n=1 Tax=Phialocephala subalpina TaxID=576137 RepID=A0A1L7XKT0_9HELO|nr:related to allantoate permease [Phialocephala subalpina]
MANEIDPATPPELHDDQKHTSRKGDDVESVHVERMEYAGKDLTDFNAVDSEVAKYTSDVRVHIDEATSKRLKKLIDRRVLAIMIFTYFLQALDKGTMSFASIMGIQEDTGLVGQQFSWLTTCIYIAVLIVEYPTNWIIQRVPIAKYLSINIMLWGATLMCHAACKNFASLVAVRTLLGIFEACCQPSFVILSSMWYLRDEQAATVSFWYMMNGAQQVVGGLLAYCFTLLKHGPLKSWQALFIAYGGVAILWGVFVFFWMPDSPMRAKCFSEEDKRLMVERVRVNQTGVQNKTFKREQMIEAFKDPQTWCYCGIAITTTLPTSGLGAFANIIITGFHFTVLQTQLLAMVLGFYIIIVLLTSTWLVKKFGQNLFVMLGFVIPSFIGTIVLMTVRNTDKANQVGLLISYYLTLSFWSAQTLALSMISRNIAGQTKKATVVATNFVAWAVGNAIGPQVFLKWNAPRYLIAFTVHLVCYSILVFVILFLRWYLLRQNKKKDELALAGIQEAQDQQYVHAFEDLTDKENPNFRYVF